MLGLVANDLNMSLRANKSDLKRAGPILDSAYTTLRGVERLRPIQYLPPGDSFQALG